MLSHRLVEIAESILGGAGAKIANFPSSYAVTGTFWQATQPISGTVAISGTVPVSGSLTTVSTVTTVTNDVGVKGLKCLGDGADTAIADTSTAIAVPAGSEVVAICNKSLTASMYPGITTSQRATGIQIRPGNTLLNFPVTGLANIYLHSTVASELAGTQFYGRA